MRFSTIFVWMILVGAVLLGGCAEPAELSASKEISERVSKARALMEQGTEAAYGQARTVLQEALRTRGATAVSKQGAHELLGTLISRRVAGDLVKLAEVQQRFDQADAGVCYSLDELSKQAGALGYAAGLSKLDDRKLHKSRGELLGKIPPARQVRDGVRQVRIKLEKFIADVKKEAKAAASHADRRLLEAEQAEGDEHVRQVNEAADLRVKADDLLVQLRNLELDLLEAKEDEARVAAKLSGLENSLEHVEQLIEAHGSLARKSREAKHKAQSQAEASAKKLIARLEAFAEAGAELWKSYRDLIQSQNEAVRHFGQALAGAKTRSQKFRKFRSSRPSQAPADERVEMLGQLDSEVGLALRQARAAIAGANLQRELIVVLRQVQGRVEQIEQVRRNLGDDDFAGVSAQPQPSRAPSEGGWSVLGGLFSRPEKKVVEPAEQTTSLEVVIAWPRMDSKIVSEMVQGIEQGQKAALENYDSAIRSLWGAALGTSKEGKAQDAVKRLREKWNWQVWGMLEVAHRGRASLREQMGDGQRAQIDREAAERYSDAREKVTKS